MLIFINDDHDEYLTITVLVELDLDAVYSLFLYFFMIINYYYFSILYFYYSKLIPNFISNDNQIIYLYFLIFYHHLIINYIFYFY
jgi:hypothetical protein